MSGKHTNKGAGSNDRPKKKRGHKAKGAGTVLTSRGEITVSGITMQEWQRTPKQLLHEYCAHIKRPRPVYFEARGPNPHRARVLLRDKKGIKVRLVHLLPVADPMPVAQFFLLPLSRSPSMIRPNTALHP